MAGVVNIPSSGAGGSKSGPAGKPMLPRPTGPVRPTQPPGPRPGRIITDATARPPAGRPAPAKAAPARPAVKAAPAKPPAPAAPLNYLAPMSQAAIQQQAQNEILKSYAPSFNDLNAQESRANGLADKRASDNKYYQAWLDTQGAALQSHADAANQALEQQAQQLQAQQQGLYSHQAGDLVAAANATPGNVSNNADSHAFGSQLASNQAANVGLLGDAQKQALTGGEIRNNQLGGAIANDANVLQAGRTKQLSDLQTTLAGIGAQRSKLQLTQGAAIAKEITRLQGVEVSKAQANRNFDATMTKLGITQADNIRTNAQSNTNNLRSTTTSAQNNALTNSTSAQNNQRTTSTSAANNAATNATSRANNAANNATSRANNAASNATRIAVAGARQGASGGKPATPAQVRVISGAVAQARGLLNQYIGQNGLTPQQAYHLLQNGGDIKNAKGQPIHVSPLKLDPQLLNAAFNTRAGAKGLTPGDVAALRAMGITPQEIG